MTKTVLVVAAHTDDEAIGCGGAIARHVAEGDTVYAVFMADGVTSRPDSSDTELAQRQKASESAMKILGIKQSFMLGLPDNRMDTVPFLDIVQSLEKVVCEVNPAIIYTHHHGDLNIDHRITHQAVLTACRPTPACAVREIYSFEVLSATEWNTAGCEPFSPNVFIDISQYLTIKNQAIEAYHLETRPAPHTRSIENILRLAEYRGNTVGVEAAEAFSLVRRLV